MLNDIPLHDDDHDSITRTGGGPVRNLTAAEYAASYASGEPHHIPGEVLKQVAADVADREADR